MEGEGPRLVTVWPAIVRHVLERSHLNSMSRRILLLSGPSGGGKSTFVQHLKDGWIPDDILGALPEGAASWPVIDITNGMRREIEAKGPAAVLARLTDAPSLILHYDITSVYRFGWPGYASDPALRLLDEGRRLDIVFVKPSAGRLREQFVSRDAARQARKSRLARMWNAGVLRPLRGLRARLVGGELNSERDLYADPLWLERCYAAWSAFAADLLTRGNAQSVVSIEPRANAAGQPRFAITQMANGSAPSASGAHS